MGSIREGECRQCGRCCATSQFIVIPKPEDRILWEMKGGILKGLPPELQRKYGGSHLLVLPTPCKYLDKKTMKCKKYKERPDVCRNYPAADEKEFLPDGCGFKFRSDGKTTADSLMG